MLVFREWSALLMAGDVESSIYGASRIETDPHSIQNMSQCHIVTPHHTHHISPVCICLDKLKNKYIVYNNLFQMSGF